jgi:hypothetical protein
MSCGLEGWVGSAQTWRPRGPKTVSGLQSNLPRSERTRSWLDGFVRGVEAMTHFTTSTAAALSAALLLQVAPVAAQQPVVLGPTVYSAQAEASGAGDGQYEAIEAAGSVEASNLGLFGTENGSASALPVQYVSAAGSVAEGGLGAGLGFVGTGNASISYSFAIVDNSTATYWSPGVAQPVMVQVFASGLATAEGQGSGNGYFTLIQTSPISGEPAIQILNPEMCAGLGCFPGDQASINYAQSLSLLTNTDYEIDLSANAGAANFDAAPFSGGGTAIIDPFFALDPSDPDPGGLNLLFSPGIINSPAAAGVPEPATWVLLGAGFALLQFLAIRIRLPQMSRWQPRRLAGPVP